MMMIMMALVGLLIVVKRVQCFNFMAFNPAAATATVATNPLVF